MEKLIYGVGLNDAIYPVRPTINGKDVFCPFYAKWTHMIERCYSNLCHPKQQTYIGCSVSKEWLLFTRFRAWMIRQEWEGLTLDKDIINPGNKIYGPETCCFVSQSINKLLCNSEGSRGDYPIGVSLHKSSGKFRAMVRINGKQKYLGLFDTPEQASAAYLKAKSAHILEIAQKQSDPRVKNGLIKHVAILRGKE